MSTSGKDKFSISDILTRSLQVCNDVRHVVDSSSELLYLIDLKYFSAIPVPGPDRTVSSLHKSLRQSQFAWQKAEYFKRSPTSMPFIPLGTFIWSCGILGFQVTAQKISFFQPELADSDHSNSKNSRQWGCQINSAVSHYNILPSQDLLTLIVRAFRGTVVPSSCISAMLYQRASREDHGCNVIVRSLAENKVHPKAASAVVKALDNEVDLDNLELFNSPTLESSISESMNVEFESVDGATWFWSSVY